MTYPLYCEEIFEEKFFYMNLCSNNESYFSKLPRFHPRVGNVSKTSPRGQYRYIQKTFTHVLNTSQISLGENFTKDNSRVKISSQCICIRKKTANTYII